MIARIAGRIKRETRRALEALRARLERPRWIVRPTSFVGHEVCLLACHVSGNALSQHTRALAQAWHRQGFRVMVVAAMEEPNAFVHDSTGAPWISGLVVRPNRGYDFGSWAAGLRLRDDLRQASLVALANDSVYGPLDNFEAMLARVRASRSEIVGVTDSFERLHHLQSYLVFYTTRAMRTKAFARFWRQWPSGQRAEVIVGGELQLLFAMRIAGLTVDVLFHASPLDPTNPTLTRWRELITAGLPFVKVQLLRENPANVDLSGWENTLQRHGYDPARVAEHLGSAFAGSAAGQHAAVRRLPPAASLG